METVDTPKERNFIQYIMDEHKETGRFEGRVHTRFPPEPNGFLHIGHAKSICLNFGMAAENHGYCNLRFDDTNPGKESQEYVDSIKDDVAWLGFDWEDRLYFASDYFETFYQMAVKLIHLGKAYVCSLSADETRELRGTLTEPGRNSPYRDRSVQENLELFADMRAGKHEEGTHILRAKIDMASGNINLRDPALYRIRKIAHHRAGDSWNIYPMYDFAHPLEDSIEGITHSICTLEFEDHRPFYDWLLETLGLESHPQQIEFARLNLSYTVMSKRKLLELVEEKLVDGWDDPRLPTISGLRRRGYTPAAIKDFCARIGVAKDYSVVDIKLLEHCVREDLNQNSLRAMAVLDPLKVVVDNYPEDQVELLEATNNPLDESAGKREIPFAKVLYIEQSDFLEDAPKKFFRLSLGREVRFAHAYYMTCTRVKKDSAGNVIELGVEYDPATRGGWIPGRKVKGTVHWVSAEHAVKSEVRLFEPLFISENPDKVEDGQTFKDNINLNSKNVTDVWVEPSLAQATPEEKFQFMRTGYFCADRKDHKTNKPVFNRIVALKDSFKL
jgi:glutaminyl-tRNA synthetase